MRVPIFKSVSMCILDSLLMSDQNEHYFNHDLAQSVALPILEHIQIYIKEQLSTMIIAAPLNFEIGHNALIQPHNILITLLKPVMPQTTQFLF